MRPELSRRVGIRNQNRLIAERRIDLSRGEHRLVAIRSGRDYIFAQDVVLRRCRRDTPRVSRQIPYSRSGIGITDRNTRRLVRNGFGRDRHDYRAPD
jgi:hypothetical protein